MKTIKLPKSLKVTTRNSRRTRNPFSASILGGVEIEPINEPINWAELEPPTRIDEGTPLPRTPTCENTTPRAEHISGQRMSIRFFDDEDDDDENCGCEDCPDYEEEC